MHYYKTDLLDRSKQKKKKTKTNFKSGQKRNKLCFFSSEEGNLRGNTTAAYVTVKVMGYTKQEKNMLSRTIISRIITQNWSGMNSSWKKADESGAITAETTPSSCNLPPFPVRL